jgi:predicted molibdopterin-dependent oxidoreductase YjgC
MITLTIDGRKVDAAVGSTVLEAAREVGIDIPTLCHHQDLLPYGVCRVCVVEIIRGKRKRIVASCTYPVEEGLIVETNSEWALNVRKGVTELLLARHPNVKVIKELSSKLGITEPNPRFSVENDYCILCGLCVRACREIVGANAISFSERGITRKVSSPFSETAGDCIACGTCVYICPTGILTMKDVEDGGLVYPGGRDSLGPRRIIHNWKVNLEMEQCRVCNSPFTTKAKIEFMQKRAKVPIPYEELAICPTCKG